MTLHLPGFAPPQAPPPPPSLLDELESLEGDPDGLRYYQRRAYDAILESLKTHRSALAVAATSSGKTRLATAVAKHWAGGHVLFLAERGELVDQTCKTFKQLGLDAEVEQAEWVARPETPFVVGTVQSVRQKGRLERFGNRFGLIIIDECFPAGTLIDGVPIEAIRPGDKVWSIDHDTGDLELRPVVRTMQKLSDDMHAVVLEGGVAVNCTGNHPFFVKGRGYVQASSLLPDDMLCVWSSSHFSNAGQWHAPQDVLQGVSSSDFVGYDEPDEPEICVRPNDRSQSDAHRCCAREDVGYPSRHGSPPPSEEGKRTRCDRSGAKAGRGARMGNERDCRHLRAERVRVSDPLQARRGEQIHQSRDRSGWFQPLRSRKARAGQKKGFFLGWARVESVSRHESTSYDGTVVYNLEVEGTHTYFANGVLVHNCHHATSRSYRTVINAMPWAKVLGITATPDRGDGKAMGQVFETVAFEYDIIQGIEEGWLCPFDAEQGTITALDISTVPTSMGDLQEGELDKRMAGVAKLVARKVIDLYPDRHAIVFMPGVKSAELTSACFNEIEPEQAEWISGETHPDMRKSIIRRFRSGEVKRLVNCQIATEGFDAPICDLVVMGRPTKSRSLYAQMAGRGGRPFNAGLELYPDEEDAEERKRAIARSPKPECVLLDLVGNSGRHTLMTPVDILGGDFSGEDKQAVKKKLACGEKGDVREMLKRVKAERLAAAFRLERAEVELRPFNPFRLMGVDIDEKWQQATAYGTRPPTPGYIEALKRIGLPMDEIARISMRGAKAVLKTANERKAAGLATYRQLQVLQRYGVAETQVRFDNASRAIDYIKQAKGKPMTSELLRILGSQ